jgi:hypothetical protein
MMFALLQLYPPEASSEDDPYPLDIIALNASETWLKRYLASYRGRYREACAECDRWDQDHSSEEGADEHSLVPRQIAEAYSVYGSLITGTTFKIVRCLGRHDDQRPSPRPPV